MATRIKIPSTGLSGDLDILTSPLNKLWRAKILLNRATSTMPKADPDTSPQAKISPTINKKNQDNRRNYLIKNSELRHKNKDTPLVKPLSKTVSNQIILINYSESPYSKVVIQGMPSEIDITPDTSWATVKSIGRNNPFMMYTGGEDTVSFEISWYSIQKDRTDVINKCKLLESWTRADGYLNSPPIIGISWGNSDIFLNDSFVLVSAKYTLSNFQNSTRSNFSRRDPGNIIDLKLLPNCAVQQLIFKKVTSNNTRHEDIISREQLIKTNGVEL